jgi:uncharacterized protein
MASATFDPRPGPVIDEDSASYWADLARRVIPIQRCLNCGEVRCPPLPACANCGSTDFAEDQSCGRGVLYSWIGVHRAVGTIRPEEVPVTIATVELEEGPRLVARLEDGPRRPVIGSAVEAVFHDHPDWTELSFRPVGPQQAGDAG